MEALKAALLKAEGNRPDNLGISTQWHRNPEGPQAWAVIEALQAELTIAQKVARQWEQFGEQKEARIAQLEAALAGAREAGQAYIVFRDDVLEEAAKVARDYGSKAELRGWITSPDSAAKAAQHIAFNILNLKEPRT
jgi:hypothetical protein